MPEEPQEMPPEYKDEETDYALHEDDNTNMTLDDIGLVNYDDVEAQLSRQDMTPRNIFLKNKVIKDSKFKRYQLKGYKAQVSRAYNKCKINDAQKQMEYKRIDNARAFLNQYIGYYENKLTTVKVSRRKKMRWKCILFQRSKTTTISI